MTGDDQKEHKGLGTVLPLRLELSDAQDRHEENVPTLRSSLLKTSHQTNRTKSYRFLILLLSSNRDLDQAFKEVCIYNEILEKEGKHLKRKLS